MSERLQPSSEPEKPKPATGATEKWPTEQELREFQATQERSFGISYPIESFARDKDNPTSEEVKAMEQFNNSFRLDTPITFEEYFGYPDPRQASDDHQDSHNEPDR